METFDTNVVLRIVYDDDAAQAARTRDAWRLAVNAGGVFIPTVVLVELAWVLRVAAKFDRPAISTALRHLCDSQGVVIEEAPRVRRALLGYEAGSADFSDYMVLEARRDAGALPVHTFDERFARNADVTPIG